MKMYKKAGILFGITCIIITIVVFFFLGKVEKNIENSESSSKTEQVETIKDTENEDNGEKVDTIENEKDKENQNTDITTPSVTQPPVEKEIVIKEVSGVTTINESELSLNDKSDVKEVIVYIENKRLVLIDESIDTPNNKMLVYCFDTTSPNGEHLMLYMTKSAYDEYTVGDKLSVIYQVYTNNVGTKIPIVYAVNAVE